jgi:adenylylsulfate kinase
LPSNSSFTFLIKWNILVVKSQERGVIIPLNNNPLVWHNSRISKQDRQLLNGHRSYVLWFTGLSGSGKSTLSTALEHELYKLQCRSYVLDGDNLRHGLNRDLGFQPKDRSENIRRIGEVAKLMADGGMIVIVAAISPYRQDRDGIHSSLLPDEFIEIYVKCSIEECERRDPKGMYKKARAGEITHFTGISAPYEHPLNPHLTIETDKLTATESVNTVMDYLYLHGLIIAKEKEGGVFEG